MKKGNSNLSAEQQAELAALAAQPEEAIDTSDAPEQRDWRGARRGVFYRPVKQLLTLRLDADVVDWFKTQTPEGHGYQTRINNALRAYVAGRKRERA